MANTATLTKLFDFLKENKDRGFSLYRLREETKIHSFSLTKSLDFLEHAGLVSREKIGPMTRVTFLEGKNGN